MVFGQTVAVMEAKAPGGFLRQQDVTDVGLTIAGAMSITATAAAARESLINHQI